MSFLIFGRKEPVEALDPASVATVAAPAPARPDGIPFDGFSEEARIQGSLLATGRLSDALNRREALPIKDVVRASAGEIIADPTVTSIDPYDFSIVIASAETLPDYNRDEQMAHRIRKVPHPLILQVGSFVVTGTVWLHAGREIVELLGRATDLFVPVTGAQVSRDGALVDLGGADSVLINHFDLRDVAELRAV